MFYTSNYIFFCFSAIFISHFNVTFAYFRLSGFLTPTRSKAKCMENMTHYFLYTFLVLSFFLLILPISQKTKERFEMFKDASSFFIVISIVICGSLKKCIKISEIKKTSYLINCFLMVFWLVLYVSGIGCFITVLYFLF